MKRAKDVGLRVACVAIGLWLVAPMFVVIPLSFTGRKSFSFPPDSWSASWYDNFFSNPAWIDALFTSLQVALIVMVLAVVLGTAAAFALVRSRMRGMPLVGGVLLLPLLMPIVVAAVGTYIVFLNWHLVGTTFGFVAAHTAIALPFVVITVSSTLQTVDPQLERAAASLGAGPAATFWRVTLPLIRPGVLAGALFAFVASFDEVVISLFLVSPEKRTLPVQMYTSVTREVDPTIAVASSLTIAVAAAVLLLVLTSRKGAPRAA